MKRHHAEQRHEISDDYAERALRHAPPWVIVKVNAARERRGLRPLAVTARAGRGPIAVPAPKPVAMLTIAGVAAPFTSRPCASGRDPRMIGERFTAGAWRSIIDDVARGSVGPVVLRTSHHGAACASTADGSLDLRLDPLLGLTFIARAAARDASRLRVLLDDTFGTGVSVTFSRAVSRDMRTSAAVTVREIREARLHDISIVPSAGDARALYEGARAFAAADGSPAAVAAALDRARRWALRYGMARI
jgi:hypothetical protein